MKKLSTLSIIFIFLSVISPFSLAEVKIAVINLEKAILTTKFAQQQQKKLTDNAEYKDLVEKVQLLQADLKALQEEANDKGMTWSQEERSDHQNTFNYKRDNYQRVAKKIESQRQSTINAIREHFAKTVKQVVEQIIKDESIDLLLNAKAVHFAKPDLDITEKVTVGLDAKD